MISLNTYLNIETIKKSKKLQGIECGKYYQKWVNKPNNIDKYVITNSPEDNLLYDSKSCPEKKYYPAPTIADIIDSKLLTDKDKREIFDECIAGWNIESISKSILKRLDK